MRSKPQRRGSLIYFFCAEEKMIAANQTCTISEPLESAPWDRTQPTIAPRIELGGAIHELDALEPSILRALYLLAQLASAELGEQLWVRRY
jgi:hypothetical protein